MGNVIKMRIRQDEKTETGTVFNIDMGDNSYQTIADKSGASVANDNVEYGFRVFLQKNIGETLSNIKDADGKIVGRDANAVATYLDKQGYSYTTSDWVKGTRAVDEKAALVKDLSVEEIAAMVAELKARKG